MHSKTMPSSASLQFGTAALVVTAAYIGAQLLSDIASLKVGTVFGFAVDMGTFVYPITFTLRDIAHKTLGRKSTRVLVVLAGAVNLLMAAYLLFVARVPAAEGFQFGDEFNAVLRPIARITLASIAAEVISELIDTELYHVFVTKITRKYQWLRVLFTNSVSVPIDNLIFAFGAFLFALPFNVVVEIFVFNLIVKYLVTLISMPLIYVAKDRAGEAGED